MHRIRAIFRRPTNCTGIEKPEILKLQVSPIQERVSFCAGYSFFIPTDNDYTKETIALTKIIKTINAIHDMTSPATAKLRGVLKIPTNEKIKPKATRAFMTAARAFANPRVIPVDLNKEDPCIRQGKIYLGGKECEYEG